MDSVTPALKGTEVGSLDLYHAQSSLSHSTSSCWDCKNKNSYGFALPFSYFLLRRFPAG